MYKKKIVDFFKKKTNYGKIIFSGRTNTLIWKIGNYIKKNYQDPTIIMPSTLCVSPAVIFLNLNINIKFIDIDPNNGLIDERKLLSEISKQKFCMLFYVNLFGNLGSKNLIKKIRSIDKILIVQDLAQTFISDNKTKNSQELFGDVILLSFGYSKIFDLNEGSLLLTNDKKITKFINNSLKQKFPNINLDEVKEKYLKWYNKIFSKNLKIKAKDTKIFAKQLYLKNFKFYLYKKIYNKIKFLKFEEKRRNKIFVQYKKIFKSNKIKIINKSRNFIPWRFSFLVNKNKNKILKKLHKNNFNASSYYKSLDNTSSNSIKFGNNIINLWLDEKVNLKTIETQYKLIRKQL